VANDWSGHGLGSVRADSDRARRLGSRQTTRITMADSDRPGGLGSLLVRVELADSDDSDQAG
jgi:hypothetical protein